ncbi:MAG TPA: YajQ family cyclic di-GMP-binding protein [Planctomycetaceae bacterium]|nr:YajQ family cyclic di-GMP-binding protein [Planctomycetaceae bacterium]
MASFDVVSEVEVQEVRNAVDQAARELGTRFDFRGVDAGFDFEEGEILVWAEEEFQVHQLTDILKEKLAKRKVDVGALDAQDLEASGKQKRLKFRLRQGIDRDVSRQITKLVKDSRFKVQAQVQGDKVRVTGKKRDDLQSVMGSLRDADIDTPLQFNNFRD